MTTDQMDKVVHHQVSLELKTNSLKLDDLKDFERYRELYKMALKLLVELRQ